MFVITQDSLHVHGPLARSLTPKTFGFGMTGAEHNVERGTSIAPRTHKKISESIDTDSADSIILSRTRKKTHKFFLMPSTEIILTDNVPGLGAEADIVKVRRGYAQKLSSAARQGP